MKKIFTSFLLCVGLFLTNLSVAAPLVEGKDFVKIPVIADRIAPANGKIEVVEIFSYTCSHCFLLEPAVDKWLETKDDRIDFQKLAMPGERYMGLYAQAFYTLDSMGLGLSQKANHALFNAIHTKRLPLQTKEDIATYLAKEAAVDPETFLKNWDSFAVKLKINRATKLINEQYQLNYTPAFVVDGKYLVSAETASNYEKGKSPYQNLMTVTDLLAKQLLAERTPKETVKKETTDAPSQ